MRDPVITLVIILAIGIAAGLIARRIWRASWLRQLTGSRRADITSALVGIAGSFFGFHLGVLANLGSSGALALYAAAALGAAAVLWGWHSIKG